MLQRDIALHFKLTQSRISKILRDAGITGLKRGRPPVVKAGQDEVEAHWERVLHSYGLGVDRGLRLGSHRIVYGYDPRLETEQDDSATRVAAN
jgi:hypothetical protein